MSCRVKQGHPEVHLLQNMIWLALATFNLSIAQNCPPSKLSCSHINGHHNCQKICHLDQRFFVLFCFFLFVCLFVCLFFAKLTNPKGELHSSSPEVSNTSALSKNLSISKFVGQYQPRILQSTSGLLYEILHWNGYRSQSFQGKHILWVRALKKLRRPLVKLSFQDFWAKY